MQAPPDIGIPLLRNLILKSKILVALFSLVFASQLFILFVFGIRSILPTSVAPSRFIYFGPFLLLAGLLAEIAALLYFRKKRQGPFSISPFAGYLVTFLEISFPTLVFLFAGHIFVFAHPDYANALITSPPMLIYIIIIALSSLLLDHKISVFAGAVAAIEYFFIARWMLRMDPVAHPLDFLNANIRALLIFITGVVCGFVSNRIRSAVIDSLESKNKLIHDLDSMVHEKTREIRSQKEELQEKNKEILDSISYAQRLQEAILPPLKTVQEFFPESFILYRPKDIVAGDFYFCERTGNRVFLASADCTGHGVPGALVSMVCSNALTRAVNEFALTDPGKILDKVRELVLETFSKSESNVNDGMDISLLAADFFPEPQKTGGYSRVYWAGAHNSLWILRGEELIEIEADKQPVGKFENAHPFTPHAIEVKPGDVLLLYTDGYADQFGGPKGKKFMSKKLKELALKIRELPMTEQKRKLEETFDQWRGENSQVDDLLIIGIRI